jgi:hypothetical protein
MKLPTTDTPEVNNTRQKGRLARLALSAWFILWWTLWLPLFVLAALYVGFHIPGALLILAINGDCAASRWFHDSTDWALNGIWKISPINFGRTIQK